MNKILYIVPSLSKYSGVSSVIMNYYNNIDKEEFKIDFLVMNKKDDSYELELDKNTSEIYYLKNRFSFLKISKLKMEVEEFFKNNNYDIVELHAPTFSFIFLKIAKKYNMPIRIVHSHSTIHSTNKVKNLLSILLNLNMKKYANKFFACSEKSGKYWYGKKLCDGDSYKLITNGIDIKKYNYDEKIRNELRKKYDIEDKFVIGFVGRISKDKNLPFFIEVMKELVKKDKRYVFLVIGDGKELDNIKLQSDSIKENVIFLGRCNDVNIQLNCMDLFVLPSKREGLPMVAVEAQMVGVDCYLSNTITEEVNIGNVKFIKLDKNKWVKEILNYKKQNNVLNRDKFNIDNCVKELEDVYHKYIME